ncbi:MAG: tetratricopeptide repeat protein, partial [Gammaproteobacteria bacterium]|nr:tetratricopeptide repeat protein [Gammaproteobacteria bacterium]
LQPQQLQEAAQAGGGRFAQIGADDSDIQYLLSALNINQLDADAEATELKTDVWQEEGPWLLLLILPLAALAFRRGYLALVIVFILPVPEPAMAFGWDDLWQNNNQQAYELLQQDQAEQAAGIFKDPQWKAAAHYKARQYQQALEQLQGINTADGHYNRGNSLTQLGQLDEASKAYDEALKLDPNHEDAKFNKNLLEQMKQQQQQNQDSQSGDQSSQQQEQNQQQNSEQQKSSDEQQSSDSQSSSQQDRQSESSDSQAQQSDQDTDKQDSEQQPSQSSSDKEKESEQQQQAQAEQTKEQDDKKNEAASATDSQPDLSEQARQQWLRQIPDNPGNLLQRKFQYQYRQQKPQRNTGQAW